ncbi:MAG: hypothetical protein HYV67_01385 [Candidatus Taylorbacteria bacterium]|nr:hypothetical protein [Candidatus Taylorbacteria bacterium]
MKSVIFPLVSVFLLLQEARCQGAKTLQTSQTNLTPDVVKVAAIPKWSFAPLPPRPRASLPDTRTNKFLRIKLRKPVEVPEAKIPTPLILPAKEVMPNLYYVHLERLTSREEETDIFGRRWRLSPRVELLFPVFVWDSPSAVGGRVLTGVGLSCKF